MKTAIKQKNIFLILFMSVIGMIISLIITLIGADNLFLALLSLVIAIGSAVYQIVMLTKMVKEINIMCEGDGEHLMHYFAALLLGCVTLGIYYIYYLYRVQERLYANRKKYDVAITEKGTAIIMWYLLGFITLGICSLIALSIPIRNFNKMAYAYNKMHGLGEANNQSATENLTCKSTYSLEFTEGAEGDPAIGGQVNMKSGDLIIIGRDPSVSNFVVKDSTVSRKHCSIKVSSVGDKIMIIDHSSNGTYVGRQKLIKEIETSIAKGDVITLSNKTKFTIK